MSGYWIAGISVIAAAVLIVWWRRIARAAYAERRERWESPLAGTPPGAISFDIEERRPAASEEDTAPVYLTPPEIDVPKWAAGRGR
jgi:hypothetical protein